MSTPQHTPKTKFRSRLAFWERGTGLLAQTLRSASTPPKVDSPKRVPLAPCNVNGESSPAGIAKSPAAKSVSFSTGVTALDGDAPLRGSSFSVTPVARERATPRVPAGSLVGASPAGESPSDQQPALRTPWSGDRPQDREVGARASPLIVTP